MPPPARESLAREAQASAALSLQATRHLLRLLDELDSHGIPALALKGPALATELYGSPGLRGSNDLDVLLPPDRIEEAARLLEARGFRRRHTESLERLRARIHHLRMEHPDGHPPVELHWRLVPSRLEPSLDPSAIRARARTLELAGRAVRVPEREDLLVYLCMHGSRHGWLKLKWACDVAQLVRSGAVRWDRAFDRARRGRAKCQLHLGLLVAAALVEAPIPEEMLARCRRDRRAVSLCDEVTADPFRPADPTRSFWLHLFRARILDRWRDRIRYLAAIALRPSKADARALPLPARAALLAAPFRPIRLAVRYGPVLGRRVLRRHGFSSRPT